jgi:1,4-dihydroxy-2-naphthoate octaprenyltransferase
MKAHSKAVSLFLSTRPKFLTASISPILVGSALGFLSGGSFNWLLFTLALLAIMAFQAGANVINDYYDHLSRNDWLNNNPTPFSGGSRFIQNYLLSPKETLLLGLCLFASGAIAGSIIVLLTKSIFILSLGLIGLLGGFFYTARPVKLGYRTIGEFFIAMLFGVLPVYGAYFLQTARVDLFVLPAACIIGILVFLIILANEFPDAPADAAVNKKTLVVYFGVPVSVWIYRITLGASFIFASLILFCHKFAAGGLLYLLTLPVAIMAMKFVNKNDLAEPCPAQVRASAITVVLHTIGTIALAAGFLITAFFTSQTN